MKNRIVFVIGLLLACSVLTQAAYAQDTRKRPDDDDKYDISYQVRGHSNKSSRDRPWSKSFDSKAKAQRELKQIERDHARGGLLEHAREKPAGLYIKETKVLRTPGWLTEAKRFLDQINPSTALKEYVNEVIAAWDRAVKAKDKIGIDKLTKDQVDKVNRLIDDYHAKVAEGKARYRDARGGDVFGRFPKLDRLPAPAPSDRSVVGSWAGTYVQQGEADIPTTAVFSRGGTVTTNGGKGRGKWSLDGDSIHITWSSGARVTWRISGDQMTGGGTTPRGRSWSVTLRRQ